MKKLSSKKCIALALAVILIITSVPLTMVSAVSTGSYNPAPYWGDGSEYSAVNTNFIATLGTDGSVTIMFPDAKPQKTYDGSSTKSISSYIFTLTKITEDGETDQVIFTDKLDAAAIRTGSGQYPNVIYYGPGGLASLTGYDVAATYDVGIHAVDSDGWFSDKIHTLLSDTPYYEMSTDFSPNEAWVAREMLLFEGPGDAKMNGTSQSSGKAVEGVDYKIYSNTGVDVNGHTLGMGYKGTAGYRFWINSAYNSANAPFSAQTTWSRSHYNFENAEEVWFYVDFSRVNINKVAFTLSANEKINTYWRDGSEVSANTQYGAIFSTKAVNGVNTGTVTDGLYIQNADGLWEQTSMTDGFFTELSGYEGFVRIPIDYFVVQQDQYITVDNTYVANWSSSGYSDIDGFANSAIFLQSNATGWQVTQADGSTLTATTDDSYKFAKKDAPLIGSANWEDEYKAIYKLVVNEAGTSVTDAVIIHSWFTQYKSGTFSATKHRELGLGLHKDATATITTNADGTKTYTVNRETSPMAVSDLVSAGVEVAEWSADSVHKAFYIDQVMFCQYADGAVFNADGSVADSSPVKFPDEGGSFADDLGKKVAGYYDRTVEVPKAIAGYITEYVGEIPSLEDANALDIIDSIITTYIDCFPGCNTVAEAMSYINSQGYTEAYSRYTNAKSFLNEYFSLDDETRNQKAVEAFEQRVELLPKPDFADYNSNELKTQLGELMALYKSFNLSHFELLGNEAREKFTTLYDIIMGEEVKTGYSIGAYPFIPFNDFETNYTYGQLSEFYYDDYPARQDNKASDINSTHNFVSWVANNRIDQTGEIGGIARGWSPQDFRPTGETFGDNTYLSRMDAIILDKGFNNSQGATIRLHGELNSLGENWKLATLSTTYLGQTGVANWGALKGLDLSALSVKTEIDKSTDSTVTFDQQNVTRYGEGVIANSFVMYVDFTDVTDINMNIKFIVSDSSGTDYNCYFCGGAEDRYPIIYLLDESGNWEEQNLEITQTDIDASSSAAREVAPVTCSISASSKNTLEGYKGFIRIPLTNFRIPSYSGIANLNVDYVCLDDVLDEYTIKQAKITVWDENGANVGKEINIDAMGFTYDPACANRSYHTTTDALVNELNADNGINVVNMDEYFGVKTNDSVAFEKMVAEIDPYEGKEAFVTAYNNAKAAHDKLSFYQRQLDEIEHCYNDILVDKYFALANDNGLNYDTLMAKEPWVAKYSDTAALITDIATISDTAKAFDLETLDIVDDCYDKTTGTVKYSTLGFADKAEAEAVIEMYEKGYCRLSKANQAALDDTNKTALENAYNAAKRAILIEGYIEDMTQFKQSIISIYTDGTAEPDVKMVSYSNAALKTALDDYSYMSVYAKQILTDTTDSSIAGYKNMHASAEAVYDNSRTINLGSLDGVSGTVDGGILLLEDKMNTYAADLSAKLSSRTVLDAEFLNNIEYVLGQTESFLPRFAQVDEVNVAYHALADQLPVADITSATTQALLTNQTDNEVYSYTTDVDLSYVAARLNRSVSVYLVTDYKWTQTTGSTYDFGYFTVNGATGSDGTTVYTKLNDYENGVTAEINPVISVDETAAKNVPTGAQYTGEIQVVAFDSNQITSGVDLSTLTPVATATVQVAFASVNGTDPMVYTVTIPASVEVDWDDNNSIDVSYSVEASLGSNKLTVGVSNDGTDKMINDDTGNTFELAYTKANFGSTEFTGTVTAGAPTNAPTITVTGWDTVPVGEYRTQLTYTVDVASS